MDKNLFIECGIALYGEQWQTNLAKSLGINARRIRQWVAGERQTIPNGIWNDLEIILANKANVINQLLIDNFGHEISKLDDSGSVFD